MTCNQTCAFHAGERAGLHGEPAPRERPWHLQTHQEREYRRGHLTGKAQRSRLEMLDSLSSDGWIEPN